MYIKAFEGRDSKTNKKIIKAIAFNNHSIKWDIHKAVKEVSWATISRRVDDLKERGYITETGKRRITVTNKLKKRAVLALTLRELRRKKR